MRIKEAINDFLSKKVTSKVGILIEKNLNDYKSSGEQIRKLRET